MRMLSALLVAAAVALDAVPASRAAQPLDYDFFKAKVEPIFLEKRPTHARCYSCHSINNSALRLERLSEGGTAWTDEQSRKNFTVASQLVNPDSPEASPLLLHPLAPEAGGDPFHSGGRQFASKDDPEWKILEAWAKGAK